MADEIAIRRKPNGKVRPSRQVAAPRRRALLLLLAVLALVSAFALAGCKYSDVLTEHIEDPNAEIDESAEPIYESNPESDLELDMANLSIGEANEENTQVAKLPHYDPDAPDNGQTKQRVHGVTPHDEQASESNEPDDTDLQGTGEGSQGGENTNSSDGSDEGEGEGDGDPLQDGDSSEATESDTGSNNGETVTVDPDGTTDETAKGTVAAVGEYATIAQMLGGAGALAACDETWLAARQSDGCFSGELDKVEIGFSGDGTAEGACDVDTLVNTVQPSVVLWDSTVNAPYLSDADQAALTEAGIQVQPVPHIGEQSTEDYDVTLAVSAVASVLQGASGLQYSPADVLTQYTSFHDQVLTTCYDTNGGYSYKYCGTTQMDQLYQDSPLAGLTGSVTSRFVTAYVDKMMSPSRTTLSVNRHSASGGTETLTLDASDGVGLSAANSSRSYMVLDYYLQLAGVVNNAYDTAKPDPSGRSFILMPGFDSSNLGTSDSYGSRSNDTGSAFSYWTISSDDANWKQLGDSDFNTVLVADEDIMNAFVSSASKSNGLYRMDNSYTVAVVPSGIAGSWTGGHFDSFLLAPWAFRVQSADNLSAASDYAQSFYKTFLRCDDWEGAVADWDTSAKTQ